MFQKKWFIPAAIGVLVLFTAVMLIFVYPHNTMPSNYTEAKDGVVFIYSNFAGEGYASTGSGFAIGENGKPVQYIVTNYHVVFDEETGEKADEVIVYFSAAANRYMVAQIYRYDASKDIAVLRLPETTTEVSPLKLTKYADTDTSETFYALGYPARATVGTDFERYDKTEIVTTSGMISRQTMIDERDVYMLDLQITSGNSGGPLVNKKGEVVGINTFSITDNSGDQTNYAVCIDELTRIVSVDEVPYTLSTDTDPKGVVVISAVIVVDLVLAVLIAFAFFGKKKSDYGDTVAAEDGPGKTVALSGGIAVVSCIAGALKGQDFILKDKLVFGRDPKRCNVVLPVDAEGVSGLHCQIGVQGSKFRLKDLGSTYGTYINKGLKIDKETEVDLSDGDIFYLGSEKTKFSISIR